jgi:hypothetical protein
MIVVRIDTAVLQELFCARLLRLFAAIVLNLL